MIGESNNSSIELLARLHSTCLQTDLCDFPGEPYLGYEADISLRRELRATATSALDERLETRASESESSSVSSSP